MVVSVRAAIMYEIIKNCKGLFPKQRAGGHDGIGLKRTGEGFRVSQKRLRCG